MSIQNGFTGKKCLVTGAGRGIGRAVVADLHARGATVYALSKSPENLKTLKEQLPRVVPICVDLSDWDATREALEPLEPVDCLINNAAVCLPSEFMEITQENFDKQFNVNLKSVINVSQIIAKKMISTGKGGSIVNISSIAGRKAFTTNAVYCCTKAALEMLTKIMAVEFGPHRIRVNSINPACVDTDMLQDAMQVMRQQTNMKDQDIFSMIESKTPTKTLFMPMSDIVNAILFFASDLTSQITGENMAIDGGFLAA